MVPRIPSSWGRITIGILSATADMSRLVKSPRRTASQSRCKQSSFITQTVLRGINTPSGQPDILTPFLSHSNQVCFQSSGYCLCHFNHICHALVEGTLLWDFLWFGNYILHIVRTQTPASGLSPPIHTAIPSVAIVHNVSHSYPR